jgi:hypothetical protein
MQPAPIEEHRETAKLLPAHVGICQKRINQRCQQRPQLGWVEDAENATGLPADRMQSQRARKQVGNESSNELRSMLGHPVELMARAVRVTRLALV